MLDLKYFIYLYFLHHLFPCSLYQTEKTCQIDYHEAFSIADINPKIKREINILEEGKEFS